MTTMKRSAAQRAEHRRVHKREVRQLVQAGEQVQMNDYGRPHTVLQADVHQADSCFTTSSGRQCTCKCLALLIYTIFQYQPSIWTKVKLNAILNNGNLIYRKLSALTGQRYLLIKELHEDINYNGEHFSLRKNNIFCGTVNRLESQCFNNGISRM